MAAQVIASRPRSKAVFPLAAVQDLIRKELEEAVEESGVLHPGWEPVLDSLRIVTAISKIEDLLKLKLPPERCVRRGGFKSVDEGVKDMTERIRNAWIKAQN
jgi:acyl carrier protein